MACGTLCTSPECKLCRQCKDKCAGFFPSDSDSEKSCKKSCEVDNTWYDTVEDYLSQTAGWTSPEDEIQKAKVDAQMSAIADESTNSLFKTIGIIGVVLILILGSFLIIRKMK